MPSLIPGYEYDIFISYRQKDNKGDRWVTEFVEALKTELESTFKEDINVYFDINPHDGLLETHDVDATLKEKLKCAVFIPIISQTYCDPKSFAWVHEFKAFIEQSSNDLYGLKVKLPGGNIASRVLPVQIHDLDPEDKKLVESELGGFLRGLEFIYKEPGVNRPLRANEDHPDNNLNKTFYRNQINKVANAIKEIITGLRHPEQGEKERLKDTDTNLPRGKLQGIKIIIGTLLVLVLITAGYFIITNFLKPEEQIEKSIAVLPFHNYSENPEEWQSDGLTDEIINHLYKIKSFDRVVPLGTVLPYKNTDKRNNRIASELNVNYILQGTYKKIGDKVRVTAQLIDPQKDKYLWQQEYDRTYSVREIIAIQADISLQIAGQLKAALTDAESRNILAEGTTNQEAYEELRKVKSILLYRGRFSELADSGLKSAQRAIELDPDYADAYAYAGLFSLAQGGYYGAGGHEMQLYKDDGLKYSEKALSINPDNAIAHTVLGYIYLSGQFNYIKSEYEFKKAIDLEPNNIYPWAGYTEFLLKMGRFKDAISNINIRIAKDSSLLTVDDIPFILYKLGESKNKILSYSFSHLNEDMKDLSKGEMYLWLNQYDSAIFYINKGVLINKLVGTTPKFQAYLAVAYFMTNKNSSANLIKNQLIVKSNETKIGSPEFYLGGYYGAINMKDSAFYWLGKAFDNRSPELSWIKSDPLLDNLKDDPRYRDLYERCGFKAYDDYLTGKNK